MHITLFIFVETEWHIYPSLLNSKTKLNTLSRQYSPREVHRELMDPPPHAAGLQDHPFRPEGPRGLHSVYPTFTHQCMH